MLKFRLLNYSADREFKVFRVYANGKEVEAAYSIFGFVNGLGIIHYYPRTASGNFIIENNRVLDAFIITTKLGID
jgi:hypothetical protein